MQPSDFSFPVAVTYSHLRSIVQQKVGSLLAIASGTVASYVTPQTTIRTQPYELPVNPDAADMRFGLHKEIEGSSIIALA